MPFLTKYQHKGSAHVYKKVVDWPVVCGVAILGLAVISLLAG